MSSPTTRKTSMRYKWLRIFSASALALAMSAFLTPAIFAETSQPDTKLKVVDDSFRWGYAPRHAFLTRSFWLKPSGEDTVHIFDVVPGCSCTKSPLEKKVIAPGDSARLEIILNTGAYRGKVHKRPQIQVEHELFPHVLKVWSYAVADTQSMPRLEIIPRRFDITDGKTDAQLKIQNKTDSAISLRTIELRRDLLDVNLPDSLGPSREVTVNLKLTPPAKGWFVQSFTFGAKTAGGEELRYTVPISFGDIPEDFIKPKRNAH